MKQSEGRTARNGVDLHRLVRPIRCPKCKGVDVYLVESLIGTTEWNPGETEGVHEPGCYFRIDGNCGQCKHNWKIRGEVQITDELKERLAENYRILSNVEESQGVSKGRVNGVETSGWM